MGSVDMIRGLEASESSSMDLRNSGGVGGGSGVLTSDKVAFLLRAQFYGGPSFEKNCARGPQTHLHYTAKDLQMKLSLDI